MREHDHSESHDLFAYREGGGPRGRGAPGRVPVTAHLAPRPAPLASGGAVAMASPSAVVQRRAEPAGGPAHEDPFGMHLACDALERAAAGPSDPLPEPLRQQFGRSLGQDLSGVRVHSDERAADAASAFAARALAVGNDIYFAAGAYDPASARGQELLAHEVAHTAQQRAAPAAGGLTVSSPADACEHEADAAAEAMLRGEPAAFSPSAAAGRMVMRSPDDGAGGVRPWETKEDPEDVEAQQHGSEGADGQRAGDIERERAEDERRRAREDLKELEVNWLAEAGAGEPVDFDAMPYADETEGRACPPPVLDASLAPDWYHAFTNSWGEVEGIHRAVSPHIEAFVNASQMARELGLSRDAHNPKTQGWDPPKEQGGMEPYAEEQGVNGKHTVKEMFKNGKLDPQFQEVGRGEAGYSPEDEAAIRDALLARQQALDGVSKASTELEQVTSTTAKVKLLELQGKDLAIDKVRLSADQAEKDKQLQELTRERDRINAQIGAAMSVIEGVASVMKTRNAEAGAQGAAGGEVLKTTAGVATALVNLDYNGEINQIAAAVDGIKVQMADKDLALALLDKQKALIEYQGWVKTELKAKEAAVRTQYGTYKAAHEKAAAAFRAAAVNKTKAEQKERDEAAPGGGKPKDKSKMTDAQRAKQRAKEKADEEAQQVAGDRAEAVLRALAVIDTVIDKAAAGAGACREPGYSAASGIGFAIAGEPAEMLTRVAAIRGYRAGFQLVAARWRERRKEVADLVDSHAY